MRDSANDPISETEAARLFGVLSDLPVLVLAVSGGPDSTAMLWLAARWRDGLERPPKLVAVTVDHGLRKESAKEAAAVKRLARDLKVEHRTLRWTGAKPKTGIQAAAREARYRLLGQVAKETDARHVATAHTLDDQAETVLFRMARGSGVSGLAGMARMSRIPIEEGREIQLVRPLLTMQKARLLATLRAAGVSFADDPSNRDPRFTRPRLRVLMPMLAREGLTAERLGLLAHRIERVDDALRGLVNIAHRTLWADPWLREGPISVGAQAFFEMPAEVGIKLLARMIAAVGLAGSPELGQLETLYAELLAASGPSERLRRTLAGALIAAEKGVLTVERAPPRRSGTRPSSSGVKTGKTGRKRSFTKAR